MRATLRTYLSVLILVLWVGALTSVHADEIHLRSGKILEGQVVGQTRFQVRIRTEEGTQSVARSAVKRIVFGNAAPPAPEPEPAPVAASETAPVVKPDPSASNLNQPTASKAGPGSEPSLAPDLLAALQKQAEEARKRAELERKRREWRRKQAQREEELARRKQQREEYRRDKDIFDGAFWRSLVAPGWGQHHKGEQRKAAILGGVAAGAGGLALLALRDYNQALVEFNSSSDLAVLGANDTPLALIGYTAAEEARTTAQFHGQRMSFLLLVYLGNYIYNLFDVRTDRPDRPRFSPLALLPPEPRMAGITIQLYDHAYDAKAAREGRGPADRGMVLSYSWSF